MFIEDPIKVRNPKGKEYWVDRKRWEELKEQGFELVHDPKGELTSKKNQKTRNKEQ